MSNLRKATFATLAIMIALAFITIPVQAAEADGHLMLNHEIKEIVQVLDKNGNPYIRAIVMVTQELNGFEYETGIPTMFFGDRIEDGQKLKAGDILNAIVSVRVYQGRTSYTIIAMVDESTS